MIHCTKHVVQPLLLQLFNEIFKSGVFPQKWTEAIILPIHKAGSYDEPDNYRGIALTSILSKVFIQLLTCRLQTWVEDKGIQREEQAGFRHGYSAVDNIFVLHNIIQKYLSKQKKLYVCFIDFKKAFDYINRQVLWDILGGIGVQGRLLRMLKAMYASVQYCVRGAEGRSHFFESLIGLKQGCKISPLLFSIMISSLADEVTTNAKHAIQIMPNASDLCMLLFADDIVVFSDTVKGLQNQL
ncbi:MAG: hypothetical protein DSZ28_04130, partial [Thiothrix sp.]